jgi:hypothetical protein
MPKSLVNNCSLKVDGKIPELLDAIGRFSERSVVRFRDISSDFEIAKKIAVIILSGSAARIVKPANRHIFTENVNLIKTNGSPIIQHLLRSPTALLAAMR